MENTLRISNAQRSILEFLKSTNEYTSVAEITRFTGTTRATVNEHLITLVGYRCVHKHPGVGHSFDYKWLRDEADLTVEIPPTTRRRTVKPVASNVVLDVIDEGAVHALLTAFSKSKWIPKMSGSVANLPLAIAMIVNQVTSIQYGTSADGEKLAEARRLLIDLHKETMHLANTVGRVLNTESLFDSTDIAEFFDVTIEKISQEELTSLVDDVRKHNG